MKNKELLSNDISIEQINSTLFGIQSDTDILNKSVCVINSTSLNINKGTIYDPRLGCVDNNSLCETCNENIWVCTGHFGHINLNIPIIIYYKQVVEMLKIFCHKCSSLLCPENIINTMKLNSYDKIKNFIINNIVVCYVCDEINPIIKFNIYDNTIFIVYKNDKTEKELFPEHIKLIFDNIKNKDVSLLKINVTMFHPRNLVLTKFPVIPICCRPKITTADAVLDDDLSISLIEIIKNNNILNKTTKNENIKNMLKFRISTYCDNSKGKAIHNTNYKQMIGLKERIVKKNGHVRQNLMGKRCNKTGRTVVGPDPTLKLEEIGIPEKIANSLTIPIYINNMNIEKYNYIVNNTDEISVLIRNNNRFFIPTLKKKHGTLINHGDKIIRDGKEIIVTNCKIKILEDDIIYKLKDDNKYLKIDTITEKNKEIILEIGDMVERYLKDGDYIILNRQPTLHKNSMLGMKVKIKPYDIIRVNLSIVTGFNMDFDGDEGNIFIEEKLTSIAEAKYISSVSSNILSYQTLKSEIVIVQDSLLGAYNMSFYDLDMPKNKFMDCFMVIDTDYDFHKRLEFSRNKNKNKNKFLSKYLFSYIFPKNFNYKNENENNMLNIECGVLLNGYFTKNILNNIIRLLTLEYDNVITSNFIDNIQFLTNKYLELYPFSIGIKDCVCNNKSKKEIEHTINKYFNEANNINKIVTNDLIKEAYINSSLNKAKDIGLKIAKESFSKDNSFINMVSSKSKGDYFNISQITGLVGQQNINEKRILLQLSNKTRSSVHFKVKDKNKKSNNIYEDFKQKGFISNSFINGLDPVEMFLHAKSGREGIVKTAMGTSETGYKQRSIVKLNEDLKIEYDGTVRDAKKNIYQYYYGENGFDPSKVIRKNNKIFPLDIERLSEKLNEDSKDLIKISDKTIDEIIEKSIWKPNIHKDMLKQLINNQTKDLKEELMKIYICRNKLEEFKNIIINKYMINKITPGECVGIIGAQSIGERQTQTTLNTFHTAGKLTNTNTNKLSNILNMNKINRNIITKIYLNKKYFNELTPNEIRKKINYSLVELYFRDFYHSNIYTIEYDRNIITFKMNKKMLYKYRINTVIICEKIKSSNPYFIQDSDIIINAYSISLKFKSRKKLNIFKCEYIDNIYICGIKGITSYFLDYHKEWYLYLEGTNIIELLKIPLIDHSRFYTNDFWETYNTLGIIACRKLLFNEFKKVVKEVNDVHIQLIVDKMTFRGRLDAITRYTMRTNNVGPLSKATFEESFDIILNASIKTESDTNNGISSSIIYGNQPKIGTGFMGLNIDMEKLKENAGDLYSPDILNF